MKFLYFLFLLFLTNVFSQLYTKDDNDNYIPILNKDGHITKRYPGGIYVRRGQRGNYRYENVHKQMDQNWLNLQQNPIIFPPQNPNPIPNFAFNQPLRNPIPPQNPNPIPNRPLRNFLNPRNPNNLNLPPPPPGRSILGRRRREDDDTGDDINPFMPFQRIVYNPNQPDPPNPLPNPLQPPPLPRRPPPQNPPPQNPNPNIIINQPLRDHEQQIQDVQQMMNQIRDTLNRPRQPRNPNPQQNIINNPFI